MKAGIHARGRSERVTQTCHNSPDGKRGYRVRVTSRTESARGIWEILKKSVSWVESCLRRRRLTFACSRRSFNGCARDGGGFRWTSQNRKNVYLSPYLEEPLNSKVIKSFVPELRSRKCFSCFEIPMFYVLYIYILRRQNYKNPKTGIYFSHVWRRGGLALDPS